MAEAGISQPAHKRSCSADEEGVAAAAPAAGAAAPDVVELVGEAATDGGGDGPPKFEYTAFILRAMLLSAE